MKILAVDIGTGTQDIFLYDSRLDIENGYKMVAPSPTLMVNQRLKHAAECGLNVLLTGRLMGGGPSAWGVQHLLQAGRRVFAVPQAARSLNDDLDAVQGMGVTLVSEDEAAALPETVERIEMRDFDFTAIAQAFGQFDVRLDDLAALAVGVFDHGNAPAGVSDRQFRFDYLNERIRSVKSIDPGHPASVLSCFAFLPENVPPIMTRMQAVVDSARAADAPLVVMDTAPAAVLGASFDARLRARNQSVIVNAGNMHTLAFRLGPQGVEGLFEHHTGMLDSAGLDALLESLADGTLQHTDVFNQRGHGALLYTQQPMTFAEEDACLAIIGPRRSLAAGSRLRPYFPAPYGDMMLAGCFGLLAAAGDLLGDMRHTVRESLLRPGPSGRAPWDSAE